MGRLMEGLKRRSIGRLPFEWKAAVPEGLAVFRLPGDPVPQVRKQLRTRRHCGEWVHCFMG